MNATFGMIKPEGMQYVDDILRRISGEGLRIEEKKTILLTVDELETIYGNARKKIPNVYEAMKNYMTINQVMILKVTGDDCIRRLLKLRGASNAADALPGTIRGDYAKDQDYGTLYRKGEFARNVFHAADESEAEEMVRHFFGAKR